MKKLKQFIEKTKKLFRTRPKLIIPVVFIGALLIISAFECIRARVYMNSVEDYKTSARVLQLHDIVDRITRSNELSPSSYYCNLSVDTLLTKDSTTAEENQQQAQTIELQKQINKATPSPAFSSLVEILPRPKDARNTSEDMSQALNYLNYLTAQDLRSEYCIELDKVLEDISFLKDLSSPEGVGALFAGQLENFQVNIAQAQAKMLTQKFPPTFELEHIQLNEWLNTVAVSLRANSNRYQTFSATIEKDISSLDVIVASISAKSTDLQKRPELIALQASYLK